MSYVDWAAENGLEVIDANVPKIATGPDVRGIKHSI